MIRSFAFLLPLALLAACGTPQERCIRGNTGEYRVLSNLLAETNANLARGYAWREREVYRSRLDLCRRAIRDGDGEVRFVTYSCWRDVVDVERYRVPIDPAAEQRKRDYLSAKLETETARAEEVVRQCRARYPEEESAG
ncbi:hypothetical protein [Paracoccus aerodenitrificans]|uniref:hypothetical protein n=1 Tax=Paracoccus aerodenitrificans TaxID=3017781 RepID=UPI0022F12821|nr:hypothetical protein [Paracoccus aerodenitrificans]WBU65114.1 hypothetical protein PAE61_06700 [Paracoccus aerodenitrificans]